MGLARKYILECITGTPSGMSYVYITEEVTLLDAFSGITDVDTGTTYSYSAITLTQLKELSDEDYKQRVEDFLSYVGNGRLGEVAREELLSGSTYDEVLCVEPTTTTTTSTTTTNSGGVSFNVKYNNQGRSVDITSLGEHFVSGTMSLFDNNAVSFVSKLLDQGSSGLFDTTFNSGINIDNIVEDIIVLTQGGNSGKLLIGGAFNVVDSVTIKGLARLNPNGSIDSTFNNGGAGINTGTIDFVEEDSDGKYLIIGNQTEYNGISTGQFSKININGTLDTSFVVINYGSFKSVIKDSVDGRYVIVGLFGGASYTGILKVDSSVGSLYAAFNVGVGIGLTTAYDIIQASDNDFVTVGEFTTYQGNAVGGIVKIDQDGTAYDITFTTNNGSGFNGRATKIIRTSDDKYIALGRFTQFDGNIVNGIVKLNTDGSYDSGFNSGGSGFNVGAAGYPIDIKEDSSGNFIVSGNFTEYNGVTTGMAWKHVKISSTGAFIW